MTAADCVKAKPSAVPRNGAVHGCRENCGENALEKRPGIAFARGSRRATTHDALRQRNFKNAEKIQREHEHNHAQAEDEIGIGELRRPRDLVPGHLQRDENKRQRR